MLSCLIFLHDPQSYPACAPIKDPITAEVTIANQTREAVPRKNISPLDGPNRTVLMISPDSDRWRFAVDQLANEPDLLESGLPTPFTLVSWTLVATRNDPTYSCTRHIIKESHRNSLDTACLSWARDAVSSNFPLIR